MVSLFCLVGSIALYFSLGHISEERARSFPRVVISIMIALSFLMLVQNLLMKRLAAPKAAGKPYPWGSFLTLFILILVYLAALEPLGFYFTTFLFFVAVYFIVGRSELTGKTAGKRVLVSAAFTGVLYVLFKVLLVVQTPTGLLF